MKKPSEVIYEKAIEMCKFNQELVPNDEMMLRGILSYLDEEKERVNGVLHELVHMMYSGSFDTHNSNYLHAMIDETLTSSNK